MYKNGFERMVGMAVYCNNCGAEAAAGAKYCSSCGSALETNYDYENVDAAQNQTNTGKTVKTVATVAGLAVGASLLGNMLHRRRRPPMPPHGGMMGGPMGGPMGGHGPRR